MLRPPTIAGSAAAITPPKTRNSTTATSGSASTSMRFWSVAMVPVSALAIGSRPASWTLPPFELLQVRLDVLVVGQDRVVVVALERDADEGVLAVLAGHPLDDGVGAGGRRQPAGPADDLVGMVLLEVVELVDDLLLPGRVVDRRWAR